MDMLDFIDRLLAFVVRCPKDKPGRVIVFGRYQWRDVETVGADAPVWRNVPGVAEVEVAESFPALLLSAWRSGGNCLVIPFRERQLLFCPRLFWGLLPSRRALAICRDKLRFDRFVRQAELSEFVPGRYQSLEAASFPCVVKRLNKNGGHGVAIAGSAQELVALRNRRPFRHRPILLQELVPGLVDYATHCVCRDGRIVWHCTYEYQIDPNVRVQTGKSIVGRRRLEASAAEIAQMERFVAAIGYDGPASFDYRRRDDGRIMVFEINPRFGGSMMRPENDADLRAGLQAVIDHAVPPRGRR